ncbi:hypothetical protein BO86DRAFT_378613 [Aspergillus japonicus CBS 114.51]|uniref:Uncharacterized protein n=1 Tax=Aspergillus japonicus CBS 114.51 TaxID=1448312 RepID=A0A8T8X2X1_ASPJA|nr:hypothetical protein BO86DRAFT_378613 [Aspergillus japonicus CBS 114.51]RAH82478.1 hypothetical protein BO86DRAFT_378613 [Aspergillus japonicus CBS 114.51]
MENEECAKEVFEINPASRAKPAAEGVLICTTGGKSAQAKAVDGEIRNPIDTMMVAATALSHHCSHAMRCNAEGELNKDAWNFLYFFKCWEVDIYAGFLHLSMTVTSGKCRRVRVYGDHLGEICIDPRSRKRFKPSHWEQQWQGTDDGTVRRRDDRDNPDLGSYQVNNAPTTTAAPPAPPAPPAPTAPIAIPSRRTDQDPPGN